MNKEVRAVLLRDRFFATGGFRYVASGKSRRAERPIPKPYQLALFKVTPNEHHAMWLQEPDPKVEKSLAPKRTKKGEHHLARIAKKEPKKLLRGDLERGPSKLLRPSRQSEPT